MSKASSALQCRVANGGATKNMATTINTATWTAYNAGMVDQVSASDAATVRLVYPLHLPVILKP